MVDKASSRVGFKATQRFSVCLLSQHIGRRRITESEVHLACLRSSKIARTTETLT